MDSIQQFLGENYDLEPINDFCVMSEVPFASWMAGVDPRVKCSIPILSDMVNATATLQRHYRCVYFLKIFCIFFWIFFSKLENLNRS